MGLITESTILRSFSVISAAHFFQYKQKNSQLNFLKKTLHIIELETTSFCNRKCYFCGNSKIDRYNKFYMKEELYLSILGQLREFGFSGEMHFHRYNEPLADEIIFKRVQQAREYLPHACLSFNTNGDYLGPDSIKKLRDSGLNHLSVQAYFDPGETFSLSLAHEKVEQQTRKIGLGINFTPINSAITEYLMVQANFENLQINVSAFNMRQHGCDRGGLVDLRPQKKRSSPCCRPFRIFIIDYNGNVMPCCHLRSDEPSHEKAILGNLENSSIREVYFSEKAVEFRRKVAMCSHEPGSPCDSCTSDELNDTEEMRAEIENIFQVSRADLLVAEDKLAKAVQAVAELSKAVKAVAAQKRQLDRQRRVELDAQKQQLEQQKQTELEAQKQWYEKSIRQYKEDLRQAQEEAGLDAKA